MDTIIKKKKWTPKFIVWISIITLSVFLIIYLTFFADKSRKYAIDSEKVTIGEVKSGLFHEYIPVTGTVIPLKTIYLDAVVGGRIEETYVEAGTMVLKDSKLLRLENSDLLLDIMQRETMLHDLMNRIRNTKLTLEMNSLNMRRELIEVNYQINRTKRLFDQNKELVDIGGVSRQDYDKSRDEYEYYIKRKEFAYETNMQDSLVRKTQIEQLEDSLNRLQENFDVTKKKLEYLNIQAPITGHLTSFDKEIGELISPGERLGQIDVINDFKIRAAIDEHYISRLDNGLKGEFGFDGGTYRLVVTKIYPEVHNGRFEVDMVFTDEAPADVKRGQTFRIRLALGGLSEAMLLPRGGFYQKTGGNWIFVIDPSGTFAVKRTIKLGRQNPLHFEVIEGLVDGERVITSTYDYFGEIDILKLK